MIDYLIVGCGLAGIAFAEELEKQGKNYLVYDNRSQVSSHVAGGMYNPVILKRFTPVWRASEQLAVLDDYYFGLERKLGVQLNSPMRLLRRLATIEEQNNWFQATDHPLLAPFMDTRIHHLDLHGIRDPYGYGEVLNTGWVNTARLQECYMEDLDQRGKLRRETFDHRLLSWEGQGLRYGDMEVKKVVFCEGYGLKKNPFFDFLPLNGTKGEVLEVEIPDLDVDFILKSSVFLLPLGGRRYKVGATYKWQDKTNTPTQACKEELTEKLEKFLELPYTVKGHLAGIRPTVADRKPLFGAHPEHSNIYVFNGLGSRGVMIAPWAAPMLYRHIEKGENLPEETDALRFKKRWFKKKV